MGELNMKINKKLLQVLFACTITIMPLLGCTKTTSVVYAAKIVIDPVEKPLEKMSKLRNDLDDHCLELSSSKVSSKKKQKYNKLLKSFYDTATKACNISDLSSQVKAAINDGIEQLDSEKDSLKKVKGLKISKYLTALKKLKQRINAAQRTVREDSSKYVKGTENFVYDKDRSKNINDKNLYLRVNDIKKLHIPEDAYITAETYYFNEVHYTLSNQQKVTKKADGSLDLKTIHTETAAELEKKKLAKQIKQYYNTTVKKGEKYSTYNKKSINKAIKLYQKADKYLASFSTKTNVKKYRKSLKNKIGILKADKADSWRMSKKRIKISQKTLRKLGVPKDAKVKRSYNNGDLASVYGEPDHGRSTFYEFYKGKKHVATVVTYADGYSSSMFP